MILRLGIAVASVAALSLIAWWLQAVWLLEPKTDATEPAASHSQPVVEVLDVRVLEVSGSVEYDAGAGWTPLRAGQVVSRDGVIRTKQGGAILALGEETQIEVTENSQFRVGELTSNLSKVRLEGGRIEARVRGGADGKLAVGIMGSDAVAETSDGDFAVLRSADAQVTVASRRGEVEVAAEGESVVVGEGQLSVVEPKQKPTIPEKIPPSLFLKLTNKPKSKLRKREVKLEGVTAPGAIVSVGGVSVATKEGHFSATVPLEEGHNELEVEVRDALGRETEQKLPKVFVDTRAPKVQGRVVW